MLMKHILLSHINETPVIPSDWTKAECQKSFDRINGQLHDLLAEAEAFETKHGFRCPHKEREAIEASAWIEALDEAIKTR